MQRKGSVDNAVGMQNNPFSKERQRLITLLPDLKKKDVENMQPDERDDVVEYSEQLTVEWVHAFLDEIYRIDDFFKKKQTELIDNFIGLQDKFRIRTEKYEYGSNKTGKSRKSKSSNRSKNSAPSDAMRLAGKTTESAADQRIMMEEVSDREFNMSPRSTERPSGMKRSLVDQGLRSNEAGMSRPFPGAPRLTLDKEERESMYSPSNSTTPN